MEIIALTTSSFGKFDKTPLDLLKDTGFEVVLNPYGRKLVRDEILDICRNAAGIIAGTETLDAEILKGLPNLKVISRCGTGMDNVDIPAARSLGMKVFNTPDAPTLAVAELTLGLALNLLRCVSKMDNDVRKGKWKKLMGNLLSGRTVGIIGYGKIGRKFGELLRPFECRIIYFDIAPENREHGSGNCASPECVGLDDLLKASDIVSIHVSSKEQIIGKREIGLMKEGALLINVSRGGVVDEDVLFYALKEGRLAGAALDVFKHEPYSGCCKELDNIILTPHIGSYAMEARVKMETEAVENLLKGLGYTV